MFPRRVGARGWLNRGNLNAPIAATLVISQKGVYSDEGPLAPFANFGGEAGFMCGELLIKSSISTGLVASKSVKSGIRLRWMGRRHFV